MRRELITAVSVLGLMSGVAYAQTADSNAPADSTAQPQIMDNQSGTDTTTPGMTSPGMTSPSDSSAATSSPPASSTDSSDVTTTTTDSSGSSMSTGADMATAEKMLGADVIGSDGEDLGEVEDIILDTSGQATQLVIASGGFLGIGEKQVAIDFSSATWNEGEGQVQLSGLTQDQIKEMTEFEYSDTTTSLNRRIEERDAQSAPATGTSPGVVAPAPSGNN